MERAELENLIREDIENGLKYREIMKKHNLKSNFLIKKLKGKKTEGEYLKINISINKLNDYTEEDLFNLYLCVKSMSTILKTKKLQKVCDYIKDLIKDKI